MSIYASYRSTLMPVSSGSLCAPSMLRSGGAFWKEPQTFRCSMLCRCSRVSSGFKSMRKVDVMPVRENAFGVLATIVVQGCAEACVITTSLNSIGKLNESARARWSSARLSKGATGAWRVTFAAPCGSTSKVSHAVFGSSSSSCARTGTVAATNSHAIMSTSR